MATSTVSIPTESNLTGTIINSALSATGLTCYASFIDKKTGLARAPQTTTLLFTIDYDNSSFETILADTVSTTSGITTITINAAGRGVPLYGVGAGSGTGVSHVVGASIACVDVARPLNMIKQILTEKLNVDGTNSMTGALPLAQLTTVQRTALTPVNGCIVYDTDLGQIYQYITGAWSPVAAGSTQPDASLTVAGKSQLATSAQINAGTATGSTGAPIVMTPDNFATSNYATNTSLPAGEAVDGSTTPQAVFISDGTNGKTAGRFYKADADNTTDAAGKVAGFVCVNAATPGTSYAVQTRGIVPGFTGLTQGKTYYLSTTAGGITVTTPAGDAQSFAVGIAITTTQLAFIPSKPGSMPLYWGSGSTPSTQVSKGTTATLTRPTNFRVKTAYFTIYMYCVNAANSAGMTIIYTGVWIDTPGTLGQWQATAIQADKAATTFASISYINAAAAPYATGISGDYGVYTLGFSTSDSVFTATLANVTTGGAGSNLVQADLSAILFPY